MESTTPQPDNNVLTKFWGLLEQIPRIGGVFVWARTRPLLTIVIWGVFASSLGAALGLVPFIGDGLKWAVRVVSFGLVFGLGVRWAVQGSRIPVVREQVNGWPTWGRALGGTGLAIAMMATLQTTAYSFRANFDRIATGHCYPAEIISTGAETQTKRYGKTPLWSVMNLETGEALTVRTEDVLVPLGLRIDSADLAAQLNARAGNGEAYRLCTVGRNISATASFFNPAAFWWRGERPYATRVSVEPLALEKSAE